MGAVIGRYARLLWIRLRASLLLRMQYRLDFVVELVLTVFWVAAALVPLLALFELRTSVAGWERPQALLVVAFFTLLKSVLAGAIQPSLNAVVEHIRNGTLDFVLLKPADAQFLVSTARFDPARVAELIAGLAILGYAVRAGDLHPPLSAIAAAAAILVGAVLILYSLWILVVSLAFLVVKVDNLTYLFSSIYDAARWPASVFRGAVAIVLTFVIPIAIMTTYPALALRELLTAREGLIAAGVTAAFVVTGRLVWLRSIGHYTSAGG